MNRKIFVSLLIFVNVLQRAICSDPIDLYLEQLFRSHVIPGFSVVIVKGNNIIFRKGYGVEYLGGETPMTASTSTAVGSLAKSFTALAMLQLVEQGKINLDEQVIKYIPWFRTANKEFSDRITVRMLLNNTSGLQAPAIRNKDNSGKAAENLVLSIESVYLTTEPGTHYEYSNDGFALAGLIISQVSGMTYEDYLHRFVFEPLEMNRTTNKQADFEPFHALYGHYPGIDRGIPVHREDSWLAEYVAAGSLLRSSANDLGNYIIALLNGGTFKGRTVVSPESIRQMWKSYSSFPGISAEDGGKDLPFNYGLGWFSGELDGKKYIFHGGNRRNMSSMTFLFPEEKIGVAFLANIDLTFIDKYRYPNLINILNNIIRVSMNEPVSDFAVPAVSDPTRNAYELPADESQKYVGEYRMTEGNDWVYLGSRLTITKVKEGLIGEISKGGQTLEKFRIDYLTKKTAVSRNISMPHRIIFSFSQSGKVTDVIIASRKYSRLSEGYYDKFRPETSADNNLSFYFPLSWHISWNGNNFEGSGTDQAQIQISGRTIDQKMKWEECFKELFPGRTILHTGQQLSEVIGEYLWYEVAVISSDGNKACQHYLCTTGKDKNGYLVILTSENLTTTVIASVIPTLLGTFEWRDK